MGAFPAPGGDRADVDRGGWWERWRRPVLAAGLLAVIAAVAWQARSGLDRIDGTGTPSIGVLAAVAVLAAAGQLAAGAGWSATIGGRASVRASSWAFHGAQPAKYLPGGLGQAAAQVALAVDGGTAARTAVTSFVVASLLLAAAGSVTGSVLAVVADQPAWLVLSGLGLVGVVVAVRPVLVVVAARVGSRIERLADLEVPSQGRVAAGFGASFGFVLAQGTALALLADRFGGDVQPLRVVGAFGLAFAIGLALAPVPAGLGVREAVLVATAGLASAAVLPAAVVLRLVTIAVESALWLVTAVLVRPRRATTQRKRGSSGYG